MQPIKIGSLQLRSNIVQGPLAGYSCAPFRVLTTRYGKPGFCTTEMISAKDLVHRTNKPKRYLYKDPEEGLLCYQLAGKDATIMAQATAIVNQAGADIIDLNCGCPVAKIRAKGTGSRLLSEPETIYQLVTAIKNNTDAAVSIKIRIAGNIKDHNNIDVVDAAQNAGVDFISVHGRHWTERYDTPCSYKEIAEIVKQATVPIFANGDVEDSDSIKKIIQTTGCAGVMIARASVGQPWLFEKIRHELSGKNYQVPSKLEIGKILIEHIERLIALESEKLGILQSRKLAKYYARTLTDKKNFIIAMQNATTKDEVQIIINQHFNLL